MKNSKNKIPKNFEAEMFRAADKLRGQMDAAEYKHIMLGLMFLKYISDKFVKVSSVILFSFF